MAAKSSWAVFPHDAKGYAYAGDALKKAWPKLHAGDCEPFPDAKRAAALLKGAGKAAPAWPSDNGVAKGCSRGFGKMAARWWAPDAESRPLHSRCGWLTCPDCPPKGTSPIG